MSSLSERFQQISETRRRLVKEKRPTKAGKAVRPAFPPPHKPKAAAHKLAKRPQKSLDARLGKRVEDRLGKTVLERLGAPIPKGSIVVGGHVLGPKVKR